MKSTRKLVVSGGTSAVISAGASSLTGLLVNVIAATALTATGFGRFSIIYLAVLVSMTLVRALVGDVVLFAPPAESDNAVRASTAAAALLSAPPVAALIVLGAIYDRSGLAAAASITAVCIQDNYRYIAFSRGRISVAAASDVLTLTPPALLLAFGTRTDDAGVYAFLAWGLGAGLGTVLAHVLLRPATSANARSLLSSRFEKLRRASIGEYLSTSLVYQLPLLLLPAVSPVRDVGAMRGLQMAYSPVTISHAAVFALVVPRLTSAYESTRQVRMSLIGGYILALSSLILIVSAIIATAPLGVTTRVLGQVSEAVQAGTWWYATVQFAAVLTAAATMVHRIRQTYVVVERARLAAAVAAPVLALVGAATFGVPGVCVGLASSQFLYLVAIRKTLQLSSKETSSSHAQHTTICK